MSYVVTGATGRLGRLTVDSLLARGVDPADILATGRDPERLEGLAERGVRTARLDFSDVPTDVLAAGDVVIAFDGHEIDTMRELPLTVAETPVGKRVQVTVMRKKAKVDIAIDVGQLEENEARAEDEAPKVAAATPAAPPAAADDQRAIDALGLTVAPLTDARREEFKIGPKVTGSRRRRWRRRCAGRPP
jgi:uncharacterized protein YbjT (DUF2867 family)